MTCQQNLAAIDQFPFTQARPHQLAAIERHARDCAKCRDALAAAKALDRRLQSLPEPGPPADLATVIMARTAQLEEERAAAGRQAEKAAATSPSDLAAWTALLVGVLCGVGAFMYRLAAGESTLSPVSPLLSGMMKNLMEMAQAPSGVLVLAAGLILYATGLFAVGARRAAYRG